MDAYTGATAAAATTAGRDIIAEYADYGSRVYGPLNREGRFPDRLRAATRLVPKLAQTEGLEGLATLSLAATGVAERVLGRACEDSITLAVEWVNLPSRARGVATYTASWAAPTLTPS
jgi:hypothetical protein